MWPLCQNICSETQFKIEHINREMKKKKEKKKKKKKKKEAL